MADKSLTIEAPPLHQRKRVPMHVIRTVVQHIAENFDPDQIILFGSHAYGQPEPWSDVDLLVVKDIPDGEETRAVLEIYHSLPTRAFGVDIVVRSREVLTRRKALGDWFLREITAKGRVMYERPGWRADEDGQERLLSEGAHADDPEKAQLMQSSHLNPLTEEWIIIAESDYDTVWLAMEAAEVPIIRGVCFHAQQCAEKYLKAYLTEKQIEFPRQHPLIPLMKLCLPEDPEFRTLEDDLRGLEGYAVAMRYPGAEVTLEMAEDALAAVRRVRTFIRAQLGLN